MRIVTAFLIATAFAPQVAAQGETGERLLLPIVGRVIPGAYGTLWASRFLFHNRSDTPIEGSTPHQCPILCGLFVDGAPVVVEQVVELSPSESKYIPAYAQLNLVLPPRASPRVTLTPLTNEKIWAFISVTSNTTQRVSMIFP